jgi:hypothetical protein
MWTAEALAAPNLTATSAEPEAPIDPEHDLGANTKASSGARPAPSSKFGPCGPWLGPATYSPHIPDPKDKRLGLDPIPVGVTYGAKSEFYQPKPSFFNILYTHPLFGHMGPWAQDKAYYLPPVNSTEGAMVPPSDRRLARVYGHNDVPVGCLAATNTSAAAAQWGALGAGAKAIHSGETIQFLMKTRTEFKYRSSPSMHPAPAPALPEMPRTRATALEMYTRDEHEIASSAAPCRAARAPSLLLLPDEPRTSVCVAQTSVSKSTHPLKRLPAHTVWRMQTDQILYGPKASQDTAAIAIKSRGAAKDSRSQFGI